MRQNHGVKKGSEFVCQKQRIKQKDIERIKFKNELETRFHNELQPQCHLYHMLGQNFVMLSFV